MNTVSAKQLKQKTGQIIKNVKAGEKLTITYRGKPVAVIAPPAMEEQNILKQLRPFAEAWKDIEETLKNTEPEFKGWREATEWVRSRS